MILMRQTHRYHFLLPGWVLGLFLLVSCKNQPDVQGVPVPQQRLARVDSMSALPQPLQIIDWHGLAVRFDRTVYVFQATGDVWPLSCVDSSRRNYDLLVVGV